MSKISENIAENKKPALIPFIVSGFPDMDVTRELLFLFQKHNVPAIELGIPFSDPLADGPVIQKAAKASLEAGTNVDKVFSLLDSIKDEFRTPIILFTYINPVLNYGLENFVNKAKEMNVSGIIIPDLPFEESEGFAGMCEQNGIDFIMLVAPTSGKDRIKAISERSRGFIYLVSSTGVTGVRNSFSSSLNALVSEIKNTINTPVAVGFGVSKPEHISELKQMGADGAIVGSAIVNIIDQYKDDKVLLLDKISEYLGSLYPGN
jgi:tryptophan synthase alpha chain